MLSLWKLSAYVYASDNETRGKTWLSGETYKEGPVLVVVDQEELLSSTSHDIGSKWIRQASQEVSYWAAKKWYVREPADERHLSHQQLLSFYKLNKLYRNPCTFKKLVALITMARFEHGQIAEVMPCCLQCLVLHCLCSSRQDADVVRISAQQQRNEESLRG